MLKKVSIKIIIFIITFIVIFSGLNNLLRYKWETSEFVMESKEQIISLPKDSVDVLFMGGSAIYADISPINLWKDYGITSFNLATSMQPPVITYYTLIEILEYQNPKLIVIDFASLFLDNTPERFETYYRRSLESILNKRIKYKAILSLAKEYNEPILSYLIPFFRYHDRWSDLKKHDFVYENKYKSHTLGGLISKKVNKVKFMDDFMNPVHVKEKPNNRSVKYYHKLIDLARENNIEILAITPPRMNSKYGRYLGTKEFCEDNDIALIDYNLEENFKQIKLDLNTDFYDILHLNENGNIKFTYTIGKYINENYKFKDKRENKNYSNWNQLCEEYIEDKILK